MRAAATSVAVAEILPRREQYQREMNCQIVHDSLHARPGWTQAYQLAVEGEAAGYGSVAVGGPWTGKPAIFEFYLAPEQRCRAFDLFEALRNASGAGAIDAQSNDPLLCVMLHAFAADIAVDRILFHDAQATAHPAPPGCVLRRATPEDAARLASHQPSEAGDWIVELNGAVAATGGVATHYNEPYADIYMEVLAPCRRRGVGAFLTQELKRICRHMGRVPCARCRPDNLASRRTLARAGFAPCGLILTGALRA